MRLPEILLIVKAEEELIHQKDTLDAIFESSPYIMMLADSDAKVVNINKVGIELSGKKIENVIGDLTGNVFNCLNSLKQQGCGKNLECANCIIRSSINYTLQTGNSLINGEGKISLLINGNTRNFDLLVSTVFVRNRDSKTVLVTIVDITDRKKAELELELYKNHLEEIVKTRTAELDHANKTLINEFEKEKEYELMLQKSLEKEKELSELKSRFISTASHEFRTPLTSVMSSAELIQRYGDNWSIEKRNNHIERIKNSVDYLTKLLDEVLTISRAETGKILFNPQMIDFYDHCIAIIQEAKLHCSDKHQFVFEYSLSKNNYMLDEKLIKFIILNLLSNAFKYSPNGGEVRLDISGGEQYITIKVKDNGIGITDADRIHLFEPFHRGKNIDEIPGTGLGLSIVQKSVEIHEGKISYNSIIGKGTTFIINIPVGGLNERQKNIIN